MPSNVPSSRENLVQRSKFPWELLHKPCTDRSQNYTTASLQCSATTGKIAGFHIENSKSTMPSNVPSSRENLVQRSKFKWDHERCTDRSQNYTTASLQCSAATSKIAGFETKLKIRRIRCLQMYPVRVRTWCKGQNSNEDFGLRVMLWQQKLFPHYPEVAGTMNRKEEGVGKVEW